MSDGEMLVQCLWGFPVIPSHGVLLMSSPLVVLIMLFYLIHNKDKLMSATEFFIIVFVV